MIDSLLQVLREIVYNARYILPYQSLNSRRRPRESLHSSMDNLVTSSASNEFDIVQRSAIRRSFRTLKKRITNSSSILRQTSIERQESKLRRRNSARSQSAVRAPSSATSTEPIHYATSRSTNSIEQDIS